MAKFALGLILSLSLSAASQAQSAQEEFTIASGGQTGVYYPVAIAICRIFNRENPSYERRCKVESTNGSIQNLRALRGNDATFAIVQSDWQSHAYEGTSIFSEAGPDRRLRSVFSLYTEAFTVLARASSGIEAIENLKGRRVNVGNEGSGQRATMEVVMDAFSWTPFDFSALREFSSQMQAQALCDREVDAIVFVAGHPSGAIKSATQTCRTNFVAVEGPQIDRLVDDKTYYRKTTIRSGVYFGQTEEVPTFGLSAMLVTRAETPDDLVGRMVRTVFENLDELKEQHPALANLEPAEMSQGEMPSPLHDAAAAFFAAAVN